MKILIVGNSGSGKSTLAARYVKEHRLAHLDLDSLAWNPTTPPTRAPLERSTQEIDAFVARNSGWVIEGCYADLLGLLASRADELIYLDLSVEGCIANAKARPWEPHKYSSPEAQDRSLAFLQGWIRDYENREDEFSRGAHEALFEGFGGKKRRLKKNADSIPQGPEATRA